MPQTTRFLVNALLTAPPPAGPRLVQRRRRASPLVQVLLNALHRQQRGLALPQRSRHGLRWGTEVHEWCGHRSVGKRVSVGVADQRS